MADLLIDVRAIHNTASSPVNRLPAELLIDIFSVVSRSESGYGEDVGVLRVSHVCGRWRSIAMGCASVWSNVSITPGVGPYNLIGLFLRRSGGIPVSLQLHNFDGHDEDSQRAWSTYCSSLDAAFRDNLRIREIVLLSSISTVRHSIFSILANYSAPKLDSLKVEKEVYGRITVDFPGLFRKPLPSLRNLDVEGIIASPNTLVTSLTNLTLRRGGTGLKLSTLLDFLEKNPKLEYLHLDAYNAQDVHDIPERKLTLHHLRTFLLDGCTSEVILSHLVLPSVSLVRTAGRDIRGRELGIFQLFPPRSYWSQLSNLLEDTLHLTVSSSHKGVAVECVNHQGDLFYASGDAKYGNNDDTTASLKNIPFTDIKYLSLRISEPPDELRVALWRVMFSNLAQLEKLELGNVIAHDVFTALTGGLLLCPQLSTIELHIEDTASNKSGKGKGGENGPKETLARLLSLLENRKGNVKRVRLKVCKEAVLVCESAIPVLEQAVEDLDFEVEDDL